MIKGKQISFFDTALMFCVALFIVIMALAKTGLLYRWFAPPTTAICKVYGETITLKDKKMFAGYQEIMTDLYQNYESFQSIDYMREQTYDTGTNNYSNNSRVLLSLINNKVIMHQAAEMKLCPLSDADQSVLSAMAHRIYKQFNDTCKQYDITETYLLERLTELKTAKLLMDEITKNITAPEADLRAAYDEQMAYETQLFKEKDYEYENFLAGYQHGLKPQSNLLGCYHTPIIVYRLDGYPMIQYLLIHKSTDENFAKIKPLAEEILAKAQAGTELVELIDIDRGRCEFEEYQLGSQSFTVPNEVSVAARTLGIPGSITGLVGANNGYYIIKLIRKIPGGPVPYEEVKEQINAALKNDERAKAWAAALARWRAEANPEPSPEKISYAK